MKRMAMIAASALLLGRGLAAQDTTQRRAPAAAAPQVTVVDAVVARSVLDRQPQDTGHAFPADVAQLISWTKVEGAGGSSIHHVFFFSSRRRHTRFDCDWSSDVCSSD